MKRIALILMTMIAVAGTAHAGYLGIRIADMDTRMAESVGLDPIRGVGVSGAVPGSPAAAAGIRYADVVLALDGTVMNSVAAFLQYMQNVPPGQTVTVRIWRSGQEMEVPIQASSPPAPASKSPEEDFFDDDDE